MGRVVVAAILGLSILAGWGGQPAGAQELEVCWFATPTENEAGPVPVTATRLVFRLGVLQTGATTYAFQGTRTQTPAVSPPSLPVFVHGAIFVQGDQVIISGSSTYDGTPNYTSRSGRGFQLRLSLTTLNGSFWSVWHDFDTSARTFTPRYAAGTVVFQACP